MVYVTLCPKIDGFSEAVRAVVLLALAIVSVAESADVA
jgi:hypothetical protein